MANVSWSFFRSRRRIDIQALVDSKRVLDYPTYLNYCSEARVVPASQQAFDAEFGPILARAPSNKEPQATVTPSAEVSSSVSNQSDTLEATVWLAGVEGDEPKSSLSMASKSTKKKKSKEEIQE